MTTKVDFIKKHKDTTPEARRQRLDELGAKYADLDDDGKREHDALAALVAEDEDAEAQARKEHQDKIAKAGFDGEC